MTDATQRLIEAAQEALDFIDRVGFYSSDAYEQLESAIAAARQEVAAQEEPHIDGWPLYSGLPPPKAEPPEVRAAEPVAWREYVEQRLLQWRQRSMNRSGDQLALDDFMDKESLADLIDYVCDEWSHPPTAPSAPAKEQ